MVHIHLPEGSNGETVKLTHIILAVFAFFLFVATIFMIITTIHEIRHW
jgi:large-conductance mechanosensitive channel